MPVRLWYQRALPPHDLVLVTPRTPTYILPAIQDVYRVARIDVRPARNALTTR